MMGARKPNAQLRIGVVGAGQIVQGFHAPALHALGHRIVWAVDPSTPNRKALEKVADGVRGFETIEEAFRIGDADAVLVASPAALHAQHVRAALEAGVAIFCEKPLACRSRDAKELAALAARCEQVLQVGYYRRHLPGLRLLKTWLNGEMFGRPKHLGVRAGAITKRIPESFLRREWSGGGVLIDWGVHAFDFIRGFAVQLQLDRYADDAAPGGIEANACARLTGTTPNARFPVIIELSRTSPVGEQVGVEFERAKVLVDLRQSHELTVMHHATPGTPLRVQAAKPRSTLDYFADQWREFAARLNGEPERAHSLSDAVEVTELVERCYAERVPLVLPWGN